MKTLFKASIFFGISIFLVACGESITPATTPVPSSTATITATLTPLLSITPSPTITPTTRPEYIQPTLIPTIDPTLVPELLSKALSIQTIEGANGYKLKQMTGWNYGFGTDIWYNYCPGYVWLDSNHILLYPGAGQEYGPEGIWGVLNVVPQPVVINLETGSIWLPPVDVSSGRTCNHVYWSRDLGILINSGTYKEEPAVFTHTFDGKKLANYRGKFTQVSPSKEKVLIDNNILIDLRTNSRTTLAWSLDEYEEQVLSGVFWTSDETRLYRCCYFYADLSKGISHRFKRSDFTFTDGTHLKEGGLWFQNGYWVRDDSYFLVWWQAVDDGDIKYLPLFDPATKVFYDVREMAGIPEEFTSLYYPVSPDGNYVWMEGWNESYIVNLTTFESEHYTYSSPSSYTDVDWSSDSKFAWFKIYDSGARSTEFKILSTPELKLQPIYIYPQAETEPLWHPTDNVFAFISEDAKTFELFDAETLVVHGIVLSSSIQSFLWSPAGERIALVAEDGSILQLDYPSLEHIEQLTTPLPNVHSIEWSPDGNYISFISGSDIYIVETTK
jgi:hypothetical protein